MDRLGQLLRLLRAFGPRLVQLGEFPLRHQIDRPDPLALQRQPLERGRLGLGIARFVGSEAELFRKPLGHAFELLDALARELGAARLLRFRARGGCGAPLAHVGRPLVGGRDRLRRIDDRLLRFAFRGRRFADSDLALLVGPLELADPGVELSRLALELGALRRLLRLAFLSHAEALLGVVLALAPFGLFTRRRAQPLAVGGSLARAGRGFGALFGNRRGCNRRAATGSFHLPFERGRIGKGGQRPLGGGHRFAGRRDHRLQIFEPLRERALLSFDPIERRRRRVDRSRGLRAHRARLRARHGARPRRPRGTRPLRPAQNRARPAQPRPSAPAREAARQAAPGGWREAAARLQRLRRRSRRTRPSGASARRE